MRIGVFVAALAGFGASALADRLPVFDDDAGYTVRSFEEGRVWVEQGAVTYLCALAPAQSPAAVVLRSCQPLVTPARHQTYAVAAAAAIVVQEAVEDAAEDQPQIERSPIDEEVADLEAFVRAVSALDDKGLAEKLFDYSRDLAALSGNSCVL